VLIDGGEKLAVTPAGSPVANSVTVPVNPKIGFTLTAKLLEWPKDIVVGLLGVTAMENVGAA
jgi:hypothetical protein